MGKLTLYTLNRDWAYGLDSSVNVTLYNESLRNRFDAGPWFEVVDIEESALEKAFRHPAGWYDFPAGTKLSDLQSADPFTKDVEFFTGYPVNAGPQVKIKRLTTSEHDANLDVKANPANPDLTWAARQYGGAKYESIHVDEAPEYSLADWLPNARRGGKTESHIAKVNEDWQEIKWAFGQPHNMRVQEEAPDHVADFFMYSHQREALPKVGQVGEGPFFQHLPELNFSIEDAAPNEYTNFCAGAKIEFGNAEQEPKYIGRWDITQSAEDDTDFTSIEKVCDRVGEGVYYLDEEDYTYDHWAIEIPAHISENLTPDKAPELERRLTLALRMLKEGK